MSPNFAPSLGTQQPTSLALTPPLRYRQSSMPTFCHRCGEELASPGTPTPSFCPHCGTPQLELAEEQIVSLHAQAATTGELPPPHPGNIAWRPVFQAALVVAGIAALLWLASLLLPGAGILCWLWIFSGSLLVLESYRRRRPTARIDAAIGARIGLAFGLTLDAALAVVLTLAGLIARFVTHSMAPIDAQITASLQAQAAQAALTAPADVLHFFSTPEFRTGLILAVLALCALILLLLSTLSGALAGMLAPRRPLTP